MTFLEFEIQMHESKDSRDVKVQTVHVTHVPPFYSKLGVIRGEYFSTVYVLVEIKFIHKISSFENFYLSIELKLQSLKV